MNIEREAIVVLGERGWARFDSAYGTDDPCCMGGALSEAAYRLGLRMSHDETREVVADVIVEQYPEFAQWREKPGACVITWNDRRGRTVDEVVAILEKAAVRRDEMAL